MLIERSHEESRVLLPLYAVWLFNEQAMELDCKMDVALSRSKSTIT